MTGQYCLVKTTRSQTHGEPAYRTAVAKLTGQEVMGVAMRRAGGGAALAKAAKLRAVSDADDLGGQVRRWADAGTPQFGDVMLRVLDYLEAINWDALDEPRPAIPGDARKSVDAMRARNRSAMDRAEEARNQPRPETGQSRKG